MFPTGPQGCGPETTPCPGSTGSGSKGTTGTGDSSCGDSCGGGTNNNPDPGQYLLPEKDRAAYLEWAANWTDPNPYATGPALELDSLGIFCGLHPDDCPSRVSNGSILDRWGLAALTVGIGGAGMIGRGEDTGPGGPSLAASEQLTAEDDLMQLEGLDTAPNRAVFWSGIRGGASTAAEWASKNGGMTLEMTLDQRGIALPNWDPSNPSSINAWRQASAEFATGASGDVVVLQQESVRISSVWAEVEYPALRSQSEYHLDHGS